MTYWRLGIVITLNISISFDLYWEFCAVSTSIEFLQTLTQVEIWSAQYSMYITSFQKRRKPDPGQVSPLVYQGTGCGGGSSCEAALFGLCWVVSISEGD